MVNTKSLTCDLPDGGGEPPLGGPLKLDCLERRFPGVSGRCQEETGSSDWLYHQSETDSG